MIRIQLPPVEVERLQSQFRATDDRKLRDRLQIVLMAHKGRMHKDIAADLAVNRKTVQRWLNAYLEKGLPGLAPRKAPGKASNIPTDLADEVKAWVIGGPTSVGLDRANWTYEEIAGHLKKAKAVKTSRSAVQRFCCKIGVRPYRPSYRFLRADPAAQEAAKVDLTDLKKSAGV